MVSTDCALSFTIQHVNMFQPTRDARHRGFWPRIKWNYLFIYFLIVLMNTRSIPSEGIYLIYFLLFSFTHTCEHIHICTRTLIQEKTVPGYHWTNFEKLNIETLRTLEESLFSLIVTHFKYALKIYNFSDYIWKRAAIMKALYFVKEKQFI